MANIHKQRTYALVGTGGCGKTTLAEMMLLQAGVVSRLGKIEDGNTVLDFADGGFDHPALAGNVVGDFLNAIDGIARGQLVQFFLSARYREFWAGLENCLYRWWDFETHVDFTHD